MADSTTKPPDTRSLYDSDFYAWTQEQARLLRQRRFSELDLANLVDEVESVGASDKREIRNRIEVIIAHLLKWKYQPGRRSSSWRETLVEQRSMLAEIVEDSPSLSGYVRDMAEKKYAGARLAAARETGLALTIFPASSPFTADAILDPDFLPEDPENE